MQAFDGGKHLAHSGMNASAVYLFDRIYSLAQVGLYTPLYALVCCLIICMTCLGSKATWGTEESKNELASVVHACGLPYICSQI